MVRLALFATYAVLAHVSIKEQAPVLQIAALATLGCGVLYQPLRHRNTAAWLAMAALIAVIVALVYSGGGRFALYVPSLVLLSLAAYGFIHSLLPGQTALITRIAAMAYQQLPEEVASYTRSLTWCWAAIIVAASVVNCYLIAAGPVQRWSAYANGYLYLIFTAVFVVEYAWRRVRFRRLNQPGLKAYLLLLARARANMA